MTPTTPPDPEPSEGSDSTAGSSESVSPAERIYLAFAEASEGRAPAEVEAAFEALCVAHPEQAAELRRLRRLEASVQKLLDGGRSFFRADASGAPAVARKAEGFARSFEPGQAIGDFELVRFLGHGGMGQVWEARQLSMRRNVALKFLLPGRADERTIALFEREARAGGRANHPNLVRTLARGQSDGIEWIAQELVEGSFSLRDAIERFRREPETPKDYYTRCATLVQGIARGLQAAHEAGVVHRDLKPQNILIDSRDMARVADFGLARVEGDTVLSKSGDIAGTYHYMSPEQVSGARSKVDARTDIFSLGVVLYELLTLQRPFSGDTTQQVTAQVTSFDPPEPSVLRAQCPRDLSVITLKALQKRQAARYATMQELADDLGRFLRHEPIRAKPSSRLESARKWVQRNPAPSVGMGVGAAALVVISGVAFYAIDQAGRAERGESAAKDNLELAERNAAEASRRADDVLALSAQKDLDELVAEAKWLWPVHPDLIPAYESWLRRARQLVDGNPADEARGLKKRPSLAERKATLAELRRDARPEDEATIQAKREALPQYAELQTKRAALRWSSRMLGLEEWPSEPAAEARLAQESLPSDADALNALAWPLVDPAKPIFGEEVRAVLIARRAVAAASEAKRSAIRDTLAWALFRAGRLDEALAEERTALAEPGGEALKDSAADLERAIALWRGDGLANQRAERDELAEEIDALARRVDELRTYDFDDPDKEWWNRQLSKLVSDLEELSHPKTGLMNDVLSEPFGWGIAKRLAFAKTLAERSVDGPEARTRWSEAIASIRSSPEYGGLELTPQLGLLPLGMDPDSGLWEFAHLQTGAPAVRGADGRLIVTEDVGLIFVLIPGGKFWMGAQARNPRGPNHDPQAERDEGPVHEVERSAYFLSKYEMTQAQWQRIAKANPSLYQPPGGWAPSRLHPVESVNWQECFDLLEKLGLSLPSEAQWECGARGGTTTAWWTGQQRESLRDKVNIADQTAKKAGAPWPDVNDWPDLEDGSVMHCAIGSHPANGFGLHEVAGNVSEWCLDDYDPAFYSKSEVVDPLSPWAEATYRVNRGGAFNISAALTRSADRHYIAPDFRNADLGVRPARAVQTQAASLQVPK